MRTAIKAIGAALCIALSVAAADDDPGIVIVVNPSVPENALARADIAKIYLGRNATWSDGSGVMLAIVPGSPIHDRFIEEFVGRTASAFATYWRKQVFSGHGGEPRTFRTEDELLRYVADTRGAVGYVSAAVTTDPQRMAGCKVITP